jgi:N-acetylmuramoyl-L-alanine amidase
MASRSIKPVSNGESDFSNDSNITDSFPEDKPLSSIQKPVIPVEFKVQIAASSRRISPNSKTFRGLTGVSEYHVGDFYKYAVGSSPTFQEIIAYSKQLKERFPDAFIIAVKDSGIIPLDQALQETQQKTSN